VFPPGLLIGRVLDVLEPSGGSAKRAILSPAARLGALREVVVVSAESPVVNRSLDVRRGTTLVLAWIFQTLFVFLVPSALPVAALAVADRRWPSACAAAPGSP
jgi:hypothetical protein